MGPSLEGAVRALSMVQAIGVVRRRHGADRARWGRVSACAIALLGLVDRESVGWEPRPELPDGPAAAVALEQLDAAVPNLLAALAEDPARAAAVEALAVVLRRELGGVAQGEVR